MDEKQILSVCYPDGLAVPDDFDQDAKNLRIPYKFARNTVVPNDPIRIWGHPANPMQHILAILTLKQHHIVFTKTLCSFFPDHDQIAVFPEQRSHADAFAGMDENAGLLQLFRQCHHASSSA
jgi:hypothetical protein